MSLIMQLPMLRLPKAVPLQRERQPMENIPQSKGEREYLRGRCANSLGGAVPCHRFGLRSYGS